MLSAVSLAGIWVIGGRNIDKCDLKNRDDEKEKGKKERRRDVARCLQLNNLTTHNPASLEADS